MPLKTCDKCGYVNSDNLYVCPDCSELLVLPHGIHDDLWVKQMHKKYPDSIIIRGMDDPASLTEKEMFRVVSLTGDAWIALKWKEAYP